MEVLDGGPLGTIVVPSAGESGSVTVLPPGADPDTLPIPPLGTESLDTVESFENEQGTSAAAWDEWELAAEAFETGQRALAAVSHPAPGTRIGVPGCGSHSPAVSCPLHGLSVARGCGSGTAPCNWQSCNATDVWLFPGTPILAVAPGKISTRFGYGLMTSGGGRFAGMRLHVEHPTGMVSFYTHMRELAVPAGTHVNGGDIVGYSGIANGVPHLHYAVTLPFDPEHYDGRSWKSSGRKPAPLPAVPGTPPVTIPPPAPVQRKQLDDAWHGLMKVQWTHKRATVKTIKATRKALSDAVR